MIVLLFFLKVEILEDNKQLQQTLAGVSLPTSQIYTVKSSGYGKNTIKST